MAVSPCLFSELVLAPCSTSTSITAVWPCLQRHIEGKQGHRGAARRVGLRPERAGVERVAPRGWPWQPRAVADGIGSELGAFKANRWEWKGHVQLQIMHSGPTALARAGSGRRRGMQGGRALTWRPGGAECRPGSRTPRPTRPSAESAQQPAG